MHEPWTFETYEAYIEWCHIGRGFLDDHSRKQRKANKANLYFFQWLIFKEQCIEMCQHIYEKPFLERNECPLSILQMVYAEVVLTKRVNWINQHPIEVKHEGSLDSFFWVREGSSHIEDWARKCPSLKSPMAWWCILSHL
jgi:hypothetical protein